MTSRIAGLWAIFRSCATICIGVLGAAGCDDPVRSDAVERIELGSPTTVAAVGATFPIAWSLIDSLGQGSGGGIPADVRMRWSSSHPAVATVSDSGVVLARAPGTTTIRLRAGKAAAEVTLEVVRPYTLTFVGVAGEMKSTANGLNEAGQVVGSTYRAEYDSSAFLWEDGRATLLGKGGAWDIADDGTIVGTSEYAAVAWKDGEKRIIYEKADGVARATAINRHGEIGGFWRSSRWCTTGGRCGGTVFRARGDRVTEVIPSEYGAEVWGINDAGWMAGSIRPVDPIPVLIREDSVYHLPLSDYWRGAHATAVNDRGQVVGYSYGSGESAIWEGAGVSMLPMSWSSSCFRRANAINNQGDIVGEHNCGAALWKGGKFVQLKYLHRDPEWEFQSAHAISERGQIVGYGRNKATGATGAILLTPPQ